MTNTRLSNEELDRYARNARELIDSNINAAVDIRMKSSSLSIAQSNLVIIELLARLIDATKFATEMNKYHI